MPVIYKITSPSNKVYIGQTWNWTKRLSSYRILHCKGQRILYRSLLKYGFENHEFEIIHTLEELATQQELDNSEVFYCKYYNDLGVPLLNIKDAGKGGKHSIETKNLIREKALGKILSEETKLKIQKSSKGRIFSEDHKMKISLSKLGKPNGTKGKIKSKEWCMQIAQANSKRIGQFNPNSKRVIDVATQNIFNCVREAAKVFEINVRTLTSKLGGSRRNNTTLMYLS